MKNNSNSRFQPRSSYPEEYFDEYLETRRRPRSQYPDLIPPRRRPRPQYLDDYNQWHEPRSKTRATSPRQDREESDPYLIERRPSSPRRPYIPHPEYPEYNAHPKRRRRKRRKSLFGRFVLLLLFAAGLCAGYWYFINDLKFEPLNRDIRGDFLSSMANLRTGVMSVIRDMPPGVPLDGVPPKPRETGWDGKNYSDGTIDMKYYTETHGPSTYHFAEVTVGHPSQLRIFWSPGKIDTPAELLRGKNSVVGINGDYAGYRLAGTIFRQGKLIFDEPLYMDLMVIDKMGDFHIIKGSELERIDSEGGSPIVLYQENHSAGIINTLHFGPAMIVDGQIDIKYNRGVAGKWGENPRPRTCIGQIGPLHYLMVCVEQGSSVEDAAGVMLEKGCIVAYNLDGGQSTSMVINGKQVNPVWDRQTKVSDVIYFVSAEIH